MTRNLRADGVSVEKPIKVDLFLGRNRGSFMDEDSRKRKTESVYLNISFCLDISFLASYVRRRHQGINMHPLAIVKVLSHNQ